MEPPPPESDQRERALISHFLASACPDDAHVCRVGPGDDAAVLRDGLAVTVDTLVEGVHWDDRLSAEDVGFKAVAVSVSDLAAMGARPAWMLLSLSVPRDDAWSAGAARGLGEASHRWRVPLIGGDTTRSAGARTLSVTMAGTCARPALRTGARPGHDLWVTGWPGLAAAGYHLASPPAAALEALRRPEPPLELALTLVEADLVGAMMDLSDGFASDLPRLCAASGVGVDLDLAALPVHPSIAEEPSLRTLQLAGGDDYVLLFSADPAHRARIAALADAASVPCHRIGRVTETPGARVDGGWPRPPFAHFEGEA